ncbi:hypothetical protein EON65_10185 [archaeon]|nr:MAG: hypothetical protein EON65_10185 [archaeon]
MTWQFLVFLVVAVTLVGQSSAVVIGDSLRERCCGGTYLYIKPYEKPIFEQINLFLFASELASRLNLTHIASNIVINHDAALHQHRGCGHIRIAKHDQESLRNTSSSGCLMELPFEDVFTLPELQQSLYPQRCLLSVQQAETLCELKLRKLSHRDIYRAQRNLMNNFTWHNTKALHDLRGNIQRLPQGLLYLSGNNVLDHPGDRETAGIDTIYLPHENFVDYRKNRYRLIKGLSPGGLLQSYLDDIFKQPAMTAGYDAIKLPVQPPLFSLSPPNSLNTSELERVVRYVQMYSPAGKRPLYVATSMLNDSLQVWKDAGYRTILFSDLKIFPVTIPDLIELLEVFICARASMFYGYDNSLFATHLYEYRYINTAKEVYSTAIFPSHDLTKPMVDCCRGGVGYDYIVNANRGLIRLQKSFNIVMWGVLTDGPTGGAAHFFLALSRAFTRMGHKTFSISRKGKGKEVISGEVVADLHILNQFQYPTSALEIIKKYPGARVVVRTDGPFYLHRNDIKQDYKLFNIIKQYGEVVVYQSQWSLDKTIEMKLDKDVQHLKHAIIGNGAEPSFFYPKTSYSQEIQSNPNYRLKVCSSVYSDSIRKNFQLVYELTKFQQSHNFELLMAGNVPTNYTSLMNATLMDEYELGHFLRRCDVFLTASWYECFSNAEVQALSCGLPVVALNESSHSHVVQKGGTVFGSFDQRFEVSLALEAISEVRKNYLNYVKNIPVYDINGLAEAYIALMK